MRLEKINHNNGGISYVIHDVSMTDLAYIQLALIESGQPELQPGEVWVRNPPTRKYAAQIKYKASGPCPCACNSGGSCGGCGHRGCGGWMP